MPTVLVIDENRATLDTIGRALRGAGFSVALASTGQEGLRLAGQRAFDLVVADLRLPDVADIEVLKQLRQTLADVPVIVTGLASTASAIEAGKLGAVDYVEKPVLADHLVRLARTLRSVDSAPPDACAPHDAMRVSPQVIRTMHVIENRYVETSLHVSAVAQDLGVSTEHLCRVLKRHTGTDVRDAAQTHARARRLPSAADDDAQHEGDCRPRGIQQRQPLRSRLQDRVRRVAVGVSRRLSGVRLGRADRDEAWRRVQRRRYQLVAKVFYQFPASNINTRQDFDRARRASRLHNTSHVGPPPRRPARRPGICVFTTRISTAAPHVSRRGHRYSPDDGEGGRPCEVCSESECVCRRARWRWSWR